MEAISNKARTPSRCREWERQRRNKFNDAITRLGEVVKEINSSNDTTGKDTENIQYPKIEIVQKAIICLTNFKQEKTQLKAEIIALQVELCTLKNKRNEVTDASTQVYFNMGRKKQNTKYIKLNMKQKSNRNALKEKPVLTKNHKLAKLLPRVVINGNKKPQENTIVVLPASPYIFPQRPILFPTVPPAIVLVDSSLQNFNKLSGPVVTRNNGDVTKTTMVNIVPISAYSRPLSATKTKKSKVKQKKDITKKSTRPPKSVDKIIETKLVCENKVKNNSCGISEDNDSNNKMKDNNVENTSYITAENKTLTKTNDPVKSASVSENNINSLANNKEDRSQNNNTDEMKQLTKKEIVQGPKNKNNDTFNAKATSATTSDAKKSSNSVTEKNEKSLQLNKTLPEKLTIAVDKDKENKLPNILDTSLCDTVVDGGNARLELAEEFLAASPTAAFLMSFPLVSGNRADSPAEEPQNTGQSSNKDNNHRRNEVTPQPAQYFDKTNTNDSKLKPSTKPQTPSAVLSKLNDPQKYTESNLIAKQIQNKATTVTTTNISHDNPFLNLPMPSLITNSTAPDTTFGLDFDCNISKSLQNPSTSYPSNSNFFYKSDPFNTVKNSIYSTSSISSSHDFNNLGLYPCAMEKYSAKPKSDFPNVEENLMKIGSSRLTYDIDLGWSHKSFDFVNCTTSSNSLNKDNILNTVAAPYSSSYNPFNPEFHVPLVSNSTKKDNVANKTNATFPDTITSFYSQPTNLWSEDVPFYTNNTATKTVTSKHQNYAHVESLPTNANVKPIEKHYETNVKPISDTTTVNILKATNVSVEPQVPEKYTKKSPSKMHINWMTSEIRHMEPNGNPVPIEIKENHKTPYTQLNSIKKQDHSESYFPISMHNFSSQPVQEEFQMWPSTKTIGPTEITMEPPPLNLPTLVGDLALGPHDKKRNAEISNKTQSQDLQNCGNFLSVTQLMNRSSNNMPSRYQVPSTELLKSGSTKQISSFFPNEHSRKTMPSRMDSQLPQPCYGFNNEFKSLNAYETMSQFPLNKNKINKSDKSSKSQKNSYSAEALIRGGGCTQKIQDNTSAKFVMSQKYNEFNAAQDSSVAQVSHFPPILDYSDNSYASQPFSGTTLYNSTTNTISNSFYTNFMPGSSNLMSSNYTSGPFSGEFIDYNQSECNYTNHKYEELKIRNNPTVFPQDKVPSNYKSSRRETATKHKLECSKKDTSKKYQSKRAKINNEVEEWNDPIQSNPSNSNLLWQNKAATKRHTNLVAEELTFPNYVGNQMPTQYQPEFFNSHLMSANVQSMGPNVDRSLSFPVTSRANFNLSTIFPEITMKVQ